VLAGGNPGFFDGASSLPTTPRTVAFRREYVDLLDGDVLSALMLSQIVYWYLPGVTGKPKLRVSKNDRGDTVWWLAKSHVDWQEELGLSRRQAQRCIQTLLAKGIIQAERFRFAGSPTVHVRLSLLEGQNLLEGPPTVADFELGCQRRAGDCTAESVGLHPDVQTYTGTTLTTTESTFIKKAKAASNDAAKEETSENKTEQGKISKKNTGVEKVKKVEEEYKENCSTVGLAPVPGPGVAVLSSTPEQSYPGEAASVKVKDIITMHQTGKVPTTVWGTWQQGLADWNKGEYQGALTQKEKGQLSHLKKKLGDKALPVLQYCLKNWLVFGEKVQGVKALGNYPSQPHIGFLLEHHAIAVNLLQSIATKKTVSSVPVKLESKGTNTQEVVSKKKEVYAPSPDEVQSYLAEFKKLKEQKEDPNHA
jgi:hypothetical protein